VAQPQGVLGPALRPIAWSALLGAAATAAFGAPAYADPSNATTVPDTGSRPVPAGALSLPKPESFTAPIGQRTPLSSLANQITAAETELSTIGEQLKQLGIELSELRSARVLADYRWRQAGDALRVAQDRAHQAANKAFKDAAGMPPGLRDLYGLGALSGVTDDSSAASEAAARDVTRAQEAEQAAQQAYLDALNAERSASARYTLLQATYKQREAALLELKRRHASELAAIEREIEANEQRLGAAYVGGDIAGMKASAQALAAVAFALRQLGKPYLWGAEGPDRYDCSGLMWAAYRSTGLTLPRVAKDQYYATRTKSVSRYALLPGDLLFFSSSSDWTGIHHVGMYIGNGKMVHAPTTGDVVKISTVWWSRFFAATRVYGPVPAPGAPAPPPPPPGAPAPPPTTAPPTRPSPTPSPTRPSPTPTTPSPTPTTPSPTPTTPSPTPTTPSPTPTTPSPTPTTPSPTPTTQSPTAAAEPTSPSPTDTTAAAPETSASTEPTTSSTASAPAPTSTSGT
jgi:cell wall-associated NlpC family hydrolase